MKKKQQIKKLTINRETLHTLDGPQGVFGGDDTVACPTHGLACNPTQIGIRCVGDTGSYDTCAPTYACSYYCTSGGQACTAINC